MLRKTAGDCPRAAVVDHFFLWKTFASMAPEVDTAAGEGAVGLKQLGGNVNPLALHRLAVVSQRQLVKMWQHD
ncbi:hypothetical protein EYF80_003337 [Liparis tanakae]|uniref:Uncharacterized protein n=1 Tax=Liparis tanakae TaxID=230148 RepID=A0A4Z2J957_9TELE|nr:hypothetical protein EYF80_003337 [Liparis tanakae]